jgi:hypothetical protein
MYYVSILVKMGEYWELSDGVSVHYIENQTDLEEKW